LSLVIYIFFRVIELSHAIYLAQAQRHGRPVSYRREILKRTAQDFSRLLTALCNHIISNSTKSELYARMQGNLFTGLMGLAMLSGLTSALDSPGYVKHALIRASTSPNAAGSTLDNLLPTVGAVYGINVTIGTPPQHMQLQIDTGSSDIVILGSNICTSPQALCNPNGNYHIDAGSYNSSRSSTSTLMPGNLTISYADTTEYNGSYYDDTFSIAGATVTNVTVGLIQDAFAPPGLPFIGIVGLGYSNGESNVTNNQSPPFPLLLEQMKSQGLIHTLAYSLYLNDKSMWSMICSG
jgi:hypothetical protein